MDIQKNDLEALLELDGIEYGIGTDYWVKFSAKKITANEHRPFGVKYSLTMHNQYGTRLVGFDNAHLADIKRKKYTAKRLAWDHKHQRGVISDYDFYSAGQLIEDFWNLIDKIIVLHQPCFDEVLKRKVSLYDYHEARHYESQRFSAIYD